MAKTLREQVSIKKRKKPGRVLKTGLANHAHARKRRSSDILVKSAK